METETKKIINDIVCTLPSFVSDKEVTTMLWRCFYRDTHSQARLTIFLQKLPRHLFCLKVHKNSLQKGPQKTTRFVSRISLSQARGTVLYVHVRGRTYVFVSLVYKLTMQH